MSDEEFEELLARSLEGSLPPADERQLWAAVEADAARLARVLEERELHADLRRALTPGGSGAAFLRGIQAELSGRRKTTRAFAKDVVRRRPPRRKARPVFWLAAAAALLVAGAYVLLSREAPPPPPVVTKPQRNRLSDSLPPRPPPPVPAPAPTPVPAPAPKPPPPPLPAPPDPVPAPPAPVPVPVPAPTPVPVPVPAPVPVPVPEKPPAPKTRSAVARVESGAPKRDVLSGDVLKTDGLLVLAFPDGTRVWLEGADVEVGEGRLKLSSGALTADVAKRPADAPFIVATPTAEARVLGTVLRIDPARLEVEEGKVRLARSDGRSVDVPAGHYATAAELRARPLPKNLLLNPGFDGDGRPWRLFTPKGEPLAGRAAVAGAGRAGTSALRIDADERYPHVVHQDVAVVPNAAYTATSWARGAGRLVIQWLRAPAEEPEVLRTDVVGVVEGETWTPLRARVVAPPAARIARVTAMTPRGEGRFWVDVAAFTK